MEQDVLPHRQHMRLEVTTGSIPREQRSRYMFVASVLDSDTVAYEQCQNKSWNLNDCFFFHIILCYVGEMKK